MTSPETKISKVHLEQTGQPSSQHFPLQRQLSVLGRQLVTEEVVGSQLDRFLGSDLKQFLFCFMFLT
jgi:hypothetical protein